MAQSELRRGSVLERQGKLNEAIAAYRVAALESPEASSRLGHIFASLGRRAEAVAAFNAAAGAEPDSPTRRMDRVRACLLDNDEAAAEAHLRKVLEEDAHNGDAHWLLGRILTEWGRFEEAAACYERTLKADPEKVGAYYDLVRVRPLTESDRPMIQAMLAAVRKVTVADGRVKVHLALAKAFDDLKDYGAAMDHIIKANRVRQSLAPFDRAALARRVDTLIARFTPEFLAARTLGGDVSRLPVLILGMPRSGTTLVEQILSSHPAVAGGGELNFWSARDQLLNPLASEASVSNSQSQTAQACLTMLRTIDPKAERVIDKNPYNFFHVGLIHCVFPQATIVHCRRHPIDTCLSIASTHLASRSDSPADLDDLVFYYRQYERLMAHWRAILPPARFVEVDYETLIAHPEQTSRNLISDLSLDWDPACLAPQDNRRTVKTNSTWQVRQPIYSSAVERWRRYEPWLGPLRQLAPG